MLLFEWCRAKAQRVHVRLVHGIVLVTLVCIKMIQTARSTTNTCKDWEPCTWLQAPHHPTHFTQPSLRRPILHVEISVVIVVYFSSAVIVVCFSFDMSSLYIYNQQSTLPLHHWSVFIHHLHIPALIHQFELLHNCNTAFVLSKITYISLHSSCDLK